MTHLSPKTPNILLQDMRKARGWTQNLLAEYMGVSVSAIQSWESGRQSNPLPAQRKKLCELFQLPPEYLGLLPWDKGMDEDDSLLPCSQESEKPEIQGFPIPSNTTSFSQAEPFFPRQNQDENRHALLSTIWDAWIISMLDAVSNREAFISLELAEIPEALTNPFQDEVQETRQSARPLSTYSITQVYEETQGALLLLGEAGAGKTTMLLELARVLLLRAKDDNNLLIPVIFHLSFWSTKHLHLADWLIEEFQRKYWIPKHIAQRWVETEQLILLLDGLDEMPEKWRSTCVKAINRYHSEHPFISLVVSSRRETYFEQDVRVHFQRAIAIQPLTSTHIEAFLSLPEQQMSGVCEVLNADPALREMMQTPLILSIVMQVLERSNGGTSETLSQKDWRSLILNAYIERMLNRRSKSAYSHDQTICALSWLAENMYSRQQESFSSEQIRSDWLAEDYSFQYFRLSLTQLVQSMTALILASLLAGFATASVCSLFLGMSNGLRFEALPGTSISLIAGGLGSFFGVLLSQWSGIHLRSWRHRTKNEGPHEYFRKVVFRTCLISSVGGIIIGLGKCLIFPVRSVREWSLLDLGLTVFLLIIFSFRFFARDKKSIVLEHILLCWFFWRKCVVPWRYAFFLNDACERLLLQKQGRNYAFMHRLLLEYLAQRRSRDS